MSFLVKRRLTSESGLVVHLLTRMSWNDEAVSRPFL